MQDSKARIQALRRLEPDHFFEPKHRAIISAMKEIDRRKLEFDLGTMQKVSSDVDIEYAKLIVETHQGAAANVAFHIERVLWDAARLNAVRGPIAALVEAINDPLADPDRVRTLARQTGGAFDGYQDRKYLRDAGEVIHEMMTEVRSTRAGLVSYSYGIDRLDYWERRELDKVAPQRRMIPGAAPGQVTCITGTPGCLAGDTIIDFNRARINRKLPLSEFVRRFQGGSMGGKVWRKDIPTRIRHRAEDGFIRLGLVLDAYSSGFKQTYEVRTADGKSVRATGDHRFLTVDGWKRLRQLRVGDMLWVDGGMCNGKKASSKKKHVTARTHPVRVTKIEERGIEETFDIEMVGEPHNFLASGFVVHNSGKSTLTARIALGLARNRRRILYGAWEMRGNTTLRLLACMSCGFERSRLVKKPEEGGLTDEELVTLEARAWAISKYVRFLDVPFNRARGEKRTRDTNDRNLDMLQGYIADSGCDVFIGDLWKRCLRNTDPDDEEQALIRQQAMCEELKIHAILVQQQRLKDVEQRSDKRPTREGIKGSGAWVEVADTILGVYRPAQWKTAMDDTVFEIDVLKQRYAAWPMAIEFEWDADTGLITGGKTVPYDSGGEDSGGGSNAEWLGGGKKGRR